MRSAIDSMDRLCVCGHNIWDHEDAEGGTHECTHSGCDCAQFKDADDDPVIDSVRTKDF